MRYVMLLGTAGLLAIGLLAVGCESTDPTAPTDGTLNVTANPGTIIIDQLLGEESGQTTIAAQVFDKSGFSLAGVAVAFTTTGGSLASSQNTCIGGVCSISGDGCRSAACPVVPPKKIETNNNGVAVDVLTLDLNDPASVDVVAFSGTLSTPVTVTKTVTDGNVQPTASIFMSPPAAQAVDGAVTFDGRNSSDPDGAITCYQWEVTSSVATSNETAQGVSLSQFTRSYAEVQELSVVLRVSDDEANGFCAPSAPPADPSFFSPLSDSTIYDVVCDTTDPIARGGPNRSIVLINGQATVTLDGSNSSDPDSMLTYSWTCGNNQDPASTVSIECTYTQAGSYTAQLVVTNECALTDVDDVTITVTNP